MAKLANRVRETTLTTGTGSLALAGAVPGYRAYSDEVSNADEVYYLILNDPDNPTAYEAGIGTFTTSGSILSRDTVIFSSNNDNKVSWQSGTKTVICAPPRQALITPDNDNELTGNNTFAGTTGFNGIVTMGAQFRTKIGTTAASTTNMALTADGNIYAVSGTNAIESITGYPAGTIFFLIATGAWSVTVDNDDIKAFPFVSYGVASGNVMAFFGHATNKATLFGGHNFIASQTSLEAGTGNLVVVPARLHFHPSIEKFHAVIDTNGSDLESYNVTSITDNGTGDWTVTIATDFSSANWMHWASVHKTAINRIKADINGKLAGSIRFHAVSQSGSESESNVEDVSIGGYGDH